MILLGAFIILCMCAFAHWYGYRQGFASGVRRGVREGVMAAYAAGLDRLADAMQAKAKEKEETKP